MPQRRTTDNFGNVEDDTARHSLDDMDDDTSETPVNVSSTLNCPNQTQKKSKKNPITPFQSNLLEHLKKNQEMTSNPDMSIVMSFLPYMELLNDEQKLEFHLNSLQYLKNIIKNPNPPIQQNVLREPQPQYPISTATLNFNNYTMNQNSSSNLQYNSSSYLNAQPYTYSYPTYTQPNYPHNSSSSYSDYTVQTTLPPSSSSQSSP
ncbi:hypothetical protein ACI65C_002049 [Semiaphis heraclei]